MDQRLEGYSDLSAKLAELGSAAQQASALRAAVATPMKGVLEKAQQNIAIVSPGERQWHKTYRGRYVTAGFASRSLRLKTRLNGAKTAATAVVGLLAEAFYAAIFLELGTSKIRAKPWLVPAFRGSEDALIAGVGATLLKRIASIAKKKAATGAG